MAGVYLPENEYAQFEAALPSHLPTPEEQAITTRWQQQRQQRQVALQAAYAPKPVQERSWLEEGLSYLGRPVSALSSAVGYGLAGQDPIWGARLGLQGQSPIQGWGDVLERQGVGEMGQHELGPLKFTGRDALGFAGDIVADPLNLIPVGTVGKAVTTGAKGLRTAAPAVEMVGQYAPKLRPIGEAVQQFNRGGIQKTLATLPGAKQIGGRFSPRMASTDPTEALMYARTMQREEGRKIVNATLMPWFEQGNPFGNVNKGMVKLSDGRTVGVKELTTEPGKYLNPDSKEYQWLTRASEVQEEVNAYAREYGVKKFAPLDLEDGTQYYHVEVRRPDGGTGRVWYKRVGGDPSFTKKRSKLSTEELVANGFEVAAPMDALRADLISAYDSVADQQWRMGMMQKGLAVADEDIAQVEKGLRTAGKMYGAEARGLKEDVRRTQGVLEKAGLSDEERQALYEQANVRYIDADDRLRDVEERFYQMQQEATLKREASGLIRPKNLFKGWTDEDVIQFAQREGRNPYQADWFDKLDPIALADARTSRKGGGKTSALRQMSPEMSQLRQERTGLRKEVRGAERELQGASDLLAQPSVESLQAQLQGATGRLSEIEGSLGALKASRQSIKQLASVPQPLTSGMRFDAKTAATLEDLIRRETANVGEILRPAAKAGQISRLATTGSDFAAATIQGLPMLFTNPVGWARATAGSLRAFVQPESIARYMSNSDNQRVWREIPGMVYGAPEWFEAMGQIGRAPKVGKALGVAERQTLGRFQAAFEGFNIIGKTEMAKALYPQFRKANRLDDLGTFLNQMFGTVSSRAQGVSATQREAESAFMFFAPRYIRASLGLVADALSDGGLKGKEARKSLGSLLAGGMATYLKFAELTGQEPVLDPTDSRFMTLQIGTDRVGIGSIWTSGGRTLAQMFLHPDKLVSTATDPKEWGNNAIIRFLRSRTPPTTSAALDLISGQTYFGEPMEDLGDYARYGAERVMPFTMASHLLQEPAADISTLPFEMMGARVFPQGYGERRDNIARAQYGVTYNQLVPREMQDVDTKLREMNLPVRGEIAKEQERIYDQQSTDLAELASGVASGELNKAQYREARGDVKKKLSTRLDDLDAKATEGKPQEEIEALNRQKEARMTDRDLARKHYFDLMDVKDAMGRPDYELAETYLASLPKDVQGYIENVGMERLKNLPPEVAKLETELRQARAKLKDYWNVQDDVLTRLGLKEQWDNMNPREQLEFKQDKQWKRVDKIVSEQRMKMRKKDKEIDQLLQEWYGYQQAKRPTVANIPGFALPSNKVANPLSKYL